MSDAQWFWLVLGLEGIVIVVVLWWGVRLQTQRFGCYVRRAEAVVERGETVALQFRAYVAYLGDLTRERHYPGCPEIPPDAFPDPVQEAEVA